MTTSTRHFTLEPSLHLQLKSKGKKLQCHKCRMKLLDNEQIVSKPANGGNYHIRYYHEKCWRSMFI